MSEWKEHRLNELADVIMGQSPPSSSYNEDNIGLPFLQGCAEFGETTPIVKYHCSAPKKIAPKNSILISVRAPVGLTNIADREFVIGRGLASIVPTNSDLKFLLYAIKQNVLKLDAVSQGSTFLAINTDELNKFKLDAPKLPEQRNIANILSTCDAVIEKTQSAIAKYKAIKQGILHDLFTRGIDLNTGKLRLKYEDAPTLYKESKLGMVPKEWGVASFENSGVEIIDGDRGVNYPKEQDFIEAGYCLFLSATNVSKDGFKFVAKQFITKEKDDLLGTGKLKREDIIVTTRGTVGNVVFYSNEVPYENIRINSGMIILRNGDAQIKNLFLYHFVKEYLFEIYYKLAMSGSAQPQLPIKDFKKFPLVYPNANEQDLITERLTSINKKLHTEQTYLHKLQSIKQGLMADLLSGKKRVKLPEEAGMAST